MKRSLATETGHVHDELREGMDDGGEDIGVILGGHDEQLGRGKGRSILSAFSY